MQHHEVRIYAPLDDTTETNVRDLVGRIFINEALFLKPQLTRSKDKKAAHVLPSVIDLDGVGVVVHDRYR